MQVKSLRINRGTYRTDLVETAVIRTAPDRRKAEQEQEIERLNLALDLSRYEAEKGAEAAFQNGMKAGYQQGFEAGRESVEPAIELMKNLAVEIEDSIHRVWDQCRIGVTDIVLAINRKVIGSASVHYSDLAKDITSRLMTMVRDQSKVTIVVNPEDAALLREARTDLLAVTEGVKTLEIIERKSVPRGGVVLETNSGQLDARLGEQLAAIDAVLKPQWTDPGERDIEADKSSRDMKIDPGQE